MGRLPNKNARTGNATRILLADNHAVLVDALRALLDSQPGMSVVGSARDGPEAVELAGRLRPDIALVAINMPGINGIEATRQIREVSESTRVVVLSTYSAADYVHRAFRAGADGYAVKEGTAADLIAGLRRVADGKRYMSDAISHVLIDEIAGGRPSVSEPLQLLAEREREVLRLTVEGKSSAAAAETLGLSPKTVESYRSRGMRKLGISDIPTLVKFAIRHGLASLE